MSQRILKLKNWRMFSTYSVAASYGFPTVDCDGGKVHDGQPNVWMSRFLNKQGKSIYIGFDHDKKVFIIHSDQ